jgi:hypothetical protein
VDETEKAHLDYFQKHALPWMIEHLRFRAIGVQIFVPTQGALFFAWHQSQHLAAVALLGLVSCVAMYLWDERVRFALFKVHEAGIRLAEDVLFKDESFRKTVGVHTIFGGELKESASWKPSKSHTFAIRLLLATCGLIWSVILLGAILELFGVTAPFLPETAARTTANAAHMPFPLAVPVLAQRS